MNEGRAAAARRARAGRALLVLIVIGSMLTMPAARAKTVCVPDDHAGGEWRMMGQDYGHGRTQHAEDKIDKLHAPLLQPAWTVSADAVTGVINNEITGYPIVADGCVFVGTSTGHGKPGWVIALNAEGGDVAWSTGLDHGVYSTLAVANGIVYAYASRIGTAGVPGQQQIQGPYVVALRESDGQVLWKTTVDHQQGSDAVSSPIVFDGMVWVGVSGTAAEGNESQRFDFRGASVLLDARTGALLAYTPSIPDADLAQGYAGGAIWSTISIDPVRKVGYVGTGNPFNYEKEHPYTNAVLKIDLDARWDAGVPTNPNLGKIIASYKGDIEEFFPPVADNVHCDESTVGAFLAGFECGRLDLDFGAAPNIFPTRGLRQLIGAGQKSGVYHAFEPDCTGRPVDANGACIMQGVWKQQVGVPSLVGGIVGTPAFDGTAIYSPHTIGGYLVALDRDDGARRWMSPVADGVHWGNPVTAANGVVYTVDLKGFLDAYDAFTGAPLLHRPIPLGADTGVRPTFSWGGVTVARNTVYASVGLGITSAGDMFPSMPDGFVIAFRPKAVP